MLLPGPEAHQLAIYIGWLMHRVPGGIVAGMFFILPSIFVLLARSYIYAAYGHVPAIVGMLDGFKPVVVAIVIQPVKESQGGIRRRFTQEETVLASPRNVPRPALCMSSIANVDSDRFALTLPRSFYLTGLG